jgi:hypothetical protein
MPTQVRDDLHERWLSAVEHAKGWAVDEEDA